MDVSGNSVYICLYIKFITDLKDESRALNTRELEYPRTGFLCGS